tara:strand:- start:232 stop:1185 length:954 start_codon:yes stop_codon:yes gene_type:complete
MTYSSGSVIVDDDYNIFATGNAAGSGDDSVANINSVLGSGSTDKGYGQSTTLAAVSAGNTVQATSWANLVARNTTLAAHQGTTLTSITQPSAGDTISAFAALSANITATYTNRNNAAAEGSDSSVTSTSTSSWNNSSTLSKTFTFASANAYRYFFNAGGQIRISWSRSGGTSSTQNTTWTNLLSAAGTLVLTGAAASKTINSVAYTGLTKIGGSGTPTTLTTTEGAYALDGTPSLNFKQVPSSPYGANEIEVSYSTTSTVLTIYTDLSDDYAPPDPSSPDNVDGTLSQVSTIRYPSTSNLSDTWGTVTQNSPSWSQS